MAAKPTFPQTITCHHGNNSRTVCSKPHRPIVRANLVAPHRSACIAVPCARVVRHRHGQRHVVCATGRGSSGDPPSASTSESPPPASSADAVLARALAYRAQRQQQEAAGKPPSLQPAAPAGAPVATSPSKYEAQVAEMQEALRTDRETRAVKEPPADAAAPLAGAVAGSSGSGSGDGFVEVQILTRDGVITRRTAREEAARAAEREGALGGSAGAGPLRLGGGGGAGLAVPGSAFLGLSFREEREKAQGRGRGPLPAGLQAPADVPTGGLLPQVEVITREGRGAGGAGQQTAAEGGAEGEGEEAYRPKVATWGVFPRPRDISKTFGGGRTLRPGEALESPEERAAREAHTRRLLAEYNRRAGLVLDPAVRRECEELLREGAALMERGKLAEAEQRFGGVVARTAFQSEIHGRALMQRAVCLDSMARSAEARALYERLAGHPHAGVKRSAQQMLFGFQPLLSRRPLLVSLSLPSILLLAAPFVPLPRASAAAAAVFPASPSAAPSLGDPSVSLEQVVRAPAAPPSPEQLSPAEAATAALFSRCTASVVNIVDAALLRVAQGGAAAFGGAVDVPEGNGSGVVWDQQGHVVTNYHVLGTSLSRRPPPAVGQVVARVTLLSAADGRQRNYDAVLVGSDRSKDLAVVRISAPPAALRPLPLGDSSSLRVGQRCLAIGNPFGFDHTLTAGVVSGLNRDINSAAGSIIAGGVQTDAAINPGNSGGPLLDSSGRLIGLNTAIFTATGTSSGVGFAIPAAAVARVVPQLIQFGKVVRPSLNVQLAPDNVARQLDVTAGALVLAVKPGSAAEKAGIQPTRRGFGGNIVPGDVITGIGALKVGTAADVDKALDQLSAGQDVVLKLRRGENTVSVPLKLEESTN